MADRPLTPKQEAFVREYLVDLNATQAAIRAGYSEQTAYRTGADNLRKPQIAAAVAAAQSARAQRTEITADRVLRELARVGFSDARRLFSPDGSLRPVAEWPDDAAAAVSSVEVFEELEGRGENRQVIGHTKKLKLWDKGHALELLAKHLGMLKDRVEHSGPDGSPIVQVVKGISEAACCGPQPATPEPGV